MLSRYHQIEATITLSLMVVSEILEKYELLTNSILIFDTRIRCLLLKIKPKILHMMQYNFVHYFHYNQ